MGINTFFFVMINRANAKIAFQFLERLFDIALQHILPPKFDSLFACLIRSQKIHSITINHLAIFLVIQTKIKVCYPLTLSRQLQIHAIAATAGFMFQYTKTFGKPVVMDIKLRAGL